jgi:hypothetical protein
MRSFGRAAAALIVLLVGLLAFGVMVYLLTRDGGSRAGGPATTPATAPINTPATQPTPPPQNYPELVKLTHPALPSTQPLESPVSVPDAAHFLLHDLVMLCARSDLWITRADAKPIEEVIRTAASEQTHLTSDRVLYVHWTLNDNGKWEPSVICGSGSRSSAIVEVVSAKGGRRPLPVTGDPHFDRAVSWNQWLIVPTGRGINVFDVGKDPIATAHIELPVSDATAAMSAPRVQFDARGMLAWAPWENGKPGSRGAMRFLDGKWSELGPHQNWPQQIVHLVPLLDGSVLQVVRGDDGKVAPAMTVLDAAEIDETTVNALVSELSDADSERRLKAYNQLTRYGPGVWPLLERLADEQPVEAQVRIQQLLSNKSAPTFGGMSLIDGVLQTATRLPDGGVVFFAPAGVLVPREDRENDVVAPAWIEMRPGRPVALLSPYLVEDATPQTLRLFAFGNEWVSWDAEHGMRRFIGNHMAPLLGSGDQKYAHFVGFDRRGRWLFKTAPEATETLIVDPRYADPTPRLPVWLKHVTDGATGWDANDCPVLKRGGAWALDGSGWRIVKEPQERVFTEQPPPARAAPILTAADGTRYFDGLRTLHAIAPDGKHTVWPLPLLAQGSGVPRLVQAPNGRLFLFNQSGRVLRIRPTPEGSEPFVLEATFTHRIPSSDDIRRIWVDPAGRVVMAYAGDKLAILFPEGRVPNDLATLIPANELHSPR